MGAFVGMLFGCGLLMIWRSGRRRFRTRRLRPRTHFERRTELLRQAGLDGVGPLQLSGLQLACGIGAFGVVMAITSTLSIAGSFGAVSAAIPVLLVRGMRRRRRAALREQWPDVVDNLASAVRAGMSLPEALGAIGESAAADLRGPFAAFAGRYRASGRFEECLQRLKDDLADPVGDQVCETLRVAREVGGNDVGQVLRTLSQLLRADVRTRAELETRQGWVVNAARLAVSAPWLVLLLLGSQSSTVRAFNSAAGVVLVLIGAAVCVIAYRLMLRIGRLPDEMRVAG